MVGRTASSGTYLARFSTEATRSGVGTDNDRLKIAGVHPVLRDGVALKLSDSRTLGLSDSRLSRLTSLVTG